MIFKDGMLEVADPFIFNKSQFFYSLLGNKTALLKRALMQKNIKIEVHPENDCPPFFYRWVARGKSKAIVFRGTMPLNTTFKANKTIKNKERTKEIVSSQGIRVPSGILIDKSGLDKACDWFDTLDRKKVVVKPLFGYGGRGVVSNVTSKSDIEEEVSLSKSKQIVLEEHVDGDDHRVLVVGGKVVAAMKRWPANIIGNGFSTIEELVEEKNAARRKNPYDRNYLIVIDSDVSEKLSKSGLSPSSVLHEGQRCFLRDIANIGAGGEGEDVTNIIHEDFIAVAVKCQSAFDGLEVCGVDIIAEDISKPIGSQAYAVIELNADCDIPIHHWPTIGSPLDVASKIADYYFPDDKKDLGYAVNLTVEGVVQKVGFRNWLSKQAITHGVTGYCKNNHDGSVFSFLEGSQCSVESVISLCANGPVKADVESVYFEMTEPRFFQGFMVY